MEERAVIVTTSHRGVFFGYITDSAADPLPMRAARNVIYWPTETRGFLGLAANGPKNGARVGPPADIELKNITCVAAVSPAALKVWEKFTW
jgi:hypothetical protein